MPVYEFDVSIEVDLRYAFNFKQLSSGASEKEALENMFDLLNKLPLSKDIEKKAKDNGLLDDPDSFGKPRKKEVKRLVHILQEVTDTNEKKS